MREQPVEGICTDQLLDLVFPYSCIGSCEGPGCSLRADRQDDWTAAWVANRDQGILAIYSRVLMATF